MKKIKIKGMSCHHCVMAVTEAIGGVKGVKNVEVNLKKGEATFDETAPVDMNLVKERVRDAGYEVK